MLLLKKINIVNGTITFSHNYLLYVIMASDFCVNCTIYQVFSSHTYYYTMVNKSKQTKKVQFPFKNFFITFKTNKPHIPLFHDGRVEGKLLLG